MAINLFKPEDLHKIADDIEMAKLKEALAKKRKKEDSERELKEAFMSREIRSDGPERLARALRNAAENGQREVMPLQFPSDWCKDKGRAINNFDPDWPKSLDGFAARAYDYYEKNLQPLGYKLDARILNYPDGMPGDVGLFLRW
ncbi:MAG: hypothetical protein AAFY56_08840 [Pseudomonadota bacterium]